MLAILCYTTPGLPIIHYPKILYRLRAFLDGLGTKQRVNQDNARGFLESPQTWRCNGKPKGHRLLWPWQTHMASELLPEPFRGRWGFMSTNHGGPVENS